MLEHQVLLRLAQYTGPEERKAVVARELQVSWAHKDRLAGLD